MPRGWCPSVFTPMEAPDGLLVRVKPRLSRFDAATARRIAGSAARHGNGRIELTSRANLQLRGFSDESARAFAADMVACGVADSDAAIERRRNIIVSPLAGDDRTMQGDAAAVALSLERALAAADDLVLPDKFGFAVDGGGVLPLGETGADITIMSGVAVRIARADQEIPCADDDAVAIALALARAFLRLGGTRRMRDVVETLGADTVYGMVRSGPVRPATRCNPLSRAASPVELTPASLTEAAERAEAIGDATLRLTPWRALLIGGNTGHQALAA